MRHDVDTCIPHSAHVSHGAVERYQHPLSPDVFGPHSFDGERPHLATRYAWRRSLRLECPPGSSIRQYRTFIHRHCSRSLALLSSRSLLSLIAAVFIFLSCFLLLPQSQTSRSYRFSSLISSVSFCPPIRLDPGSTMTPRLTSRVAIVTGSSSGIGRAISLALHHEGAHIICADLRPSPLLLNPKDDATPTHEAINALGGSAIFVKTDVSKASEVEHLVAEAVRWRGRLDIMVNDAAVAFESAQPQPVWEYDEGHFDTTMAVNCKGVWLGCKFAARQMIGQEPIYGRGKRGGDGEEEGDRGWIVNVSSVYGLRGAEGNSECFSSTSRVMRSVQRGWYVKDRRANRSLNV